MWCSDFCIFFDFGLPSIVEKVVTFVCASALLLTPDDLYLTQEDVEEPTHRY